MPFGLDPPIALGVLAAMAITDAAYVFFKAAVAATDPGRELELWYLLSAFAVINYTENALYVLFAALGSWIGAYASVTWLVRGSADVLRPQQ